MTPGAVADAVLGARLLDELDLSRIPYAVLHGEAELSQGILRSDVDLVVGAPIADVLVRLRRAAEEAGAGLVMVSPYDEGGLATFWLRRDWSGGVQIDLLRDPEGRSKLAFKTDVALQHVVRGRRWLKLTAPAEHAYLLSKRWIKGDVEALRRLRAQSDGSPVSTPLSDFLTVRRAAAVFAPRPGSPVPNWPPRALPLLRSRLSLRGLRRMRCPVGLHIGVTGTGDGAQGLADLICDRLGPIAIRTRRPCGSYWASRLRRFVSLRRPRVVVTAGSIGRRPDIEIHAVESADPGQALDQLWLEIVRLTAVRVETQLRVHHFHS